MLKTTLEHSLPHAGPQCGDTRVLVNQNHLGENTTLKKLSTRMALLLFNCLKQTAFHWLQQIYVLQTFLLAKHSPLQFWLVGAEIFPCNRAAEPWGGCLPRHPAHACRHTAAPFCSSHHGIASAWEKQAQRYVLGCCACCSVFLQTAVQQVSYHWPFHYWIKVPQYCCYYAIRSPIVYSRYKPQMLVVLSDPETPY